MAATQTNITDRALRYRANQAIPEHRHVCAFCGATSGLEVGHLDGHEENNEPENLTWTCRPCNVVVANVMRNAGLGRLTRQYNPSKSGGASSIGEWMQAVGAITPHVDRGDRGLASSMSVSDAVAMIRATPHHKRSEFAQKLKHSRRNPTRRNMWPFGEGQPLGPRTTVYDLQAARQSAAEEKRSKPKVQARYRGYTIYKTSEGEFFSSLDRDSWYETLVDVKRSIDQFKKGRAENPGLKHYYRALDKNGREVFFLDSRKAGRLIRVSEDEAKLAASTGAGTIGHYDPKTKRFDNPAKFDRCVKAVKKRGGAYDPYAVCTAQGLRNPQGVLLLFSSASKREADEYAKDARLVGFKKVSVRRVGRMWEVTAPARQNPSVFEQCVADVEARGGARDPRAVCAAAGRKKYGQREMTRRSLAGKRKAAKRNPAAAAAEGFEEFHGYPSDEIVTVEKRVHFHKHLSGAGKLKALTVKGVDHQTHTIKGFGAALLAFNEAKNQLFVEGGDQGLDLREFGIDSPHELETLGKVLAIDYYTNKTHLGEDGGRATYAHEFRTTNENGQHVTVTIARYPDLIYRVLDEQLEFAGGSYTIRAEGIDL